MLDMSDEKDKKRKLHELLDKYGSVEGIKKNAVGVDDYTYMFANTDNLIEEVLEERRLGTRPTEASNLRVNNREDVKKILNKQKEVGEQKTGDMDRINREKSLLNKAKKLGVYKNDPRFDQLVESVFEEEGGYVDNPQKIDQATNIGIIQPTLDNFNITHPSIRIDKSLKEITKNDAKLIYKLDYYDHYKLDKVNDFGNSKVLFHMFVMLKPNTVLNILHTSLNEFGYPCEKLLTKRMIPMLNKLDIDGKSNDFKKVLKSNYAKYLKNSPESGKYKGWFLRIERL